MKYLVLVLSLLAAPLYAVQPDEMLDDPMLESRARDISKGLRCPVCLNENIDDSNSGISRELRIYVRDLLDVHYLEAILAEIHDPALDPVVGQAQADIVASLDPTNDAFPVTPEYIDNVLAQIAAAGHDADAIAVSAHDALSKSDVNERIVAFLVDKYGEFILLEPEAKGANLILWIAPLVVLLLGAAAGYAAIRRKPAMGSDTLSDEEEARLQEILKS